MITKRQFNTFEDLFNYYNSELFNGELPEVMINMSRKKNSYGFFAWDRWKSVQNDDKIHEISLNPDSLHLGARLWHSTLVHEMVHLWEQVSGRKTKGGYHGKKWADKMESIGLMPSDTGAPGGKRVGQRMTHYIVTGGHFDKAFNVIQGEDFSDLKLLYVPTVPIPVITKKGTPSKEGKRKKYSCSCGNNVWGKDGLSLTCDDCGEKYDCD